MAYANWLMPKALIESLKGFARDGKMAVVSVFGRGLLGSAALCFLSCGAIAEGWETSTTISPIDDSKIVTASRHAESSFKPRHREPVTPLLVIRCQEGYLDFYIDYDVFLQNGSVTLTSRFDQLEAEDNDWGTSNDKMAALSPWAWHWAEQIIEKGHRRMAVRVTPYRENTITSVFDLTGFEEAVMPALEACGGL